MRLVKTANGMAWSHQVVYQYPFPDGYNDVLEGRGYWIDPIRFDKVLGLCYIFNGDRWRKYNPEKPWKRK